MISILNRATPLGIKYDVIFRNSLFIRAADRGVKMASALYVCSWWYTACVLLRTSHPCNFAMANYRPFFCEQTDYRWLDVHSAWQCAWSLNLINSPVFVPKTKTIVLFQPPYSPDLYPCDFFLIAGNCTAGKSVWIEEYLKIILESDF